MACDATKWNLSPHAGVTGPRELLLGQLPTPNRCDSEKDRRNPSQLRRKSPGTYALLMAPELPLLDTPRKEEATGTSAHSTQWNMDNRKSPGAAAALLAPELPTPTAQEYGTNKGGANPEGPARPGLRMMLTPTETGNLDCPSMDKWAGARALRSLMESHGVGGTVALARIYGWMMGYPPGWLDASLPPSVTRSSRR